MFLRQTWFSWTELGRPDRQNIHCGIRVVNRYALTSGFCFVSPLCYWAEHVNDDELRCEQFAEFTPKGLPNFVRLLILFSFTGAQTFGLVAVHSSLANPAGSS